MTLYNRKVMSSREDDYGFKKVKRRRPLGLLATKRLKSRSGEDEASSPTLRSVPFLRRAGSSISLTLSSFSDDSDSAATFSPLFSRLLLLDTISTQIRGIYHNFFWNGLPWEGLQCRAVKSGLSGIFFCLPALVCRQNRLEQAWWCWQATTSILADYCYINTHSAWHGIDRIIAQSSLLGIVFFGHLQLYWWVIFIHIIPAGSCFMLANGAKQEQNLVKWQWMHFLWHVIGPAVCITGRHLTLSCRNSSGIPENLAFLENACR
jgi:hypothetical protein